MSHILQAFITEEKHLKPYVRRVSLPVGLALVPIDEFLLIEFPGLEGTGTKGFSDQLCGGNQAIAVFTDYFGGIGEQRAEHSDGSQSDSINEMLRRMGVVRTESEDEFDVIGLGGFRDTSEVLDRPRDISGIKREEVEELVTELGFTLTNFYPYILRGSEKFAGFTAYINEGSAIQVDAFGSLSRQEVEKYQVDINRLEDIIMQVSAKIPDSEEKRTATQSIMERRSAERILNNTVRTFLSRKNFFLMKPGPQDES